MAAPSVLLLAGGKADTPARRSTDGAAIDAAPERVFGRARKHARCKQTARTSGRTIAIDRADTGTVTHPGRCERHQRATHLSSQL